MKYLLLNNGSSAVEQTINLMPNNELVSFYFNEGTDRWAESTVIAVKYGLEQESITIPDLLPEFKRPLVFAFACSICRRLDIDYILCSFTDEVLFNDFNKYFREFVSTYRVHKAPILLNPLFQKQVQINTMVNANPLENK